MKVYDCIVIGAGPAGLTAASIVGKNCLVLEKKRHAGLKLLITGSGQCNFTNIKPKKEFLQHIVSNRNFFKKSFYLYDNIDVISFFKSYGIYAEVMENGKVFPKSRKSQDVLNALLQECDAQNVQFSFDEEVVALKRDSHFFWIRTLKNNYLAKTVLLSTGGKSYPKTGSIGIGFQLANEIGHTIITPRPALSPILVENYPFKTLAGISIPTAIELKSDKKKITFTRDDLLFTHKGFSGPVILNNTSKMGKGNKLKFMFSNKNEDDLRAELEVLKKESGKCLFKKFFISHSLPKRYVEQQFSILKIKQDSTLGNLSKKNINIAIQNIFFPTFIIREIEGFQSAMVTAGGVSTKEVGSKTMESKIAKSLFFAGEILDIDGETGGYNLQIAFSTGYVAGKSIKHYLELSKEVTENSLH